MNLVQDFLSLLAGCVVLSASVGREQFWQAAVVGVALGALGWVGCSYFSRLWNLRFRVTWTHHVLCAIAAVLTLLFTIVFFALRYAKDAADVSVQAWEAQLNFDRQWGNATFTEAWQKVKALNKEDFTGVPPPGSPNSHIPTTQPASIKLVAETYARDSAAHFRDNRPFLSKLIQARADVPSMALDADVKNYFAAGNQTYPGDKAISLVAREVERQLEPQVPRVVTAFRTVAVLLFIAVQALPFGVVAFAAYRNLKAVT